MRAIIEELWNVRDSLNSESLKEPEIKKAILDTIDKLDNGKIKVAYKDKDGEWIVNEWVKKAIIIFMKVSQNYIMNDGVHKYFDKIPLKFDGWDNVKFETSGIRIAANCTVRKGCFIGKGAVLMPSFINIGSYIGEGTIVETWSSIGSCAQIGKNCHIGNGVGIGDVLEPISSKPVIIEDNCIIGAKSEISEGVVIEEGSVISMGVYLSRNTKIYDKESGQIFYGRVPAKSVVVSGSLPSDDGTYTTYCAVIVKRLDETLITKKYPHEIFK